MHIGIDFDNTIVSYDHVFHRVALEQKLIPAETAANKVAVRDFLRKSGREETWIEMQGYVYGARMGDAALYPGFAAFMAWARTAGHEMSIVSHKTRHPFAGPQYDLHAAARAWIDNNLQSGGKPQFTDERIYFELTKAAKLARIDTLGCDVFVDDLPEILLAETMSPNVRKLLFDPDANHPAEIHPDVRRAGSWKEICTILNA